MWEKNEMRNKWDDSAVSQTKMKAAKKSNAAKWDYVNKPGAQELKSPHKHEKFY